MRDKEKINKLFKLFVPLAGMVAAIFIIGAESSPELNNPEKLTEDHIVEKENTRNAQFQAQLVAMEEERLAAEQNNPANQITVATNSSEQTQTATANEGQAATQTGANKNTQTSSAPAPTTTAPTSQTTRTDGFKL